MKNTFLTLLDHSLVILCTYLTVLTNKTTRNAFILIFISKLCRISSSFLSVKQNITVLMLASANQFQPIVS